MAAEKRISFAEATVLLQYLAERLSEQFKTVYVDDCYKLCNKIKNAFGPHVSVKLDLFHAVQRIAKQFKKHVHTSLFLKELRLGFLILKNDGDCKDRRLLPTLSTKKLLENLDKFRTKCQQYDHHYLN